MQDVAVYHGLNKSFEMKPGRKIHWPNRDKPPLDKPECGFDGSLCEEVPFESIKATTIWWIY